MENEEEDLDENNPKYAAVSASSEVISDAKSANQKP